MSEQNNMTDEQLVATVDEAVGILAEQPTTDDAFSRVSFKSPAVGANITLLATVKALTEAAPPWIVGAILAASAVYSEEFAEQYERGTAPAVA